METNITTLRKILSDDIMTVMIRVGLIGFVLFLCARIFAPFASVMVWALVLAVAFYPLHRHLEMRLGGRPGRAATLLVIGTLLLIGVPTVMLGSSFVSQVQETVIAFRDNTIAIPQPDPGVAQWPFIGNKLHQLWQAAATDLPAFLETLQPQLARITKGILALAAQTAGGLLLFLGAVIISGVMLAYAEAGNNAMGRIFNRLAGPNKGPKLHKLSTATVRSVAIGVIGVAFIQAVLLGIGFLLAGVPAAGVWALIALLLGIMQLPAMLVTLPVIAYLWLAGDGSTVGNSVFTVYLIAASLADNFLKPMLLGRGVDAPMPVVLLGALGGMVSAGLLGLFVGATLLAAGYVIFMEWVDRPESEDTEALPAAD